MAPEVLKLSINEISAGEHPSFNKGVEKQASGGQPRRAAFWKAQHIHNM
jgi:hypothetical protein